MFQDEKNEAKTRHKNNYGFIELVTLNTQTQAITFSEN